MLRKAGQKREIKAASPADLGNRMVKLEENSEADIIKRLKERKA